MNPSDKLKSIQDHLYTSEDGDQYTIELLGGMKSKEIQNLKNSLPNQYLPPEIEELLTFSKGFIFNELDEIRFDAFGYFGFEEVFPYSIQLAGDGFGNFWILDIDSEGNWKEVYYVGHDPAVIVKHSENLSQFIAHIDEFGIAGENSHLATIHDQAVYQIWNEESGMMEDDTGSYLFETPKELPESYWIANLKDKPIGTGFAWGKFGHGAEIVRPGDDPIWVIEKKKRQGFFYKLFGLGKR
ncbi:SMI1/KNR4 family protein [Roseivirga sp. BDSF3-8]|uniref:SMI1/KNR4 family protein n=1 Tax=Roseivirga sp. BDSF3-8 TaxID=3241598 RepID=UPI003531E4BC